MFGFVRTIGFKLTIWFVSILALAILAVSALFYFGMERVLLQAVDTNLRAAGLRSVTPAPTYGDHESDEELRQLILLSNTPARLLATDGAVLQTDPPLFPTSITVSPEMLTSANAGDSRLKPSKSPLAPSGCIPRPCECTRRAWRLCRWSIRWMNR